MQPENTMQQTEIMIMQIFVDNNEIIGNVLPVFEGGEHSVKVIL